MYNTTLFPSLVYNKFDKIIFEDIDKIQLNEDGKPICLYRINTYHYDTHIKCNLMIEKIVAYTPQGYWLGSPGYKTVSGKVVPPNKSRWINASSKKRYAYPTKREAIESFLLRKKRYVIHCERRFGVAKEELALAQELLIYTLG